MEDIFVNGDIFLLCNREKTLQAEPARIRCASSCCGRDRFKFCVNVKN